jgi:hypothetical protein
MAPPFFDEALLLQGLRPVASGQAALAQFKKLASMHSPMSGKARAMVRKIDELWLSVARFS